MLQLTHRAQQMTIRVSQFVGDQCVKVLMDTVSTNINSAAGDL
jgi:hypothetical protein